MKDFRLSKDFMLSEFLKNSHNVEIKPTTKQIKSLELLVNSILQPARSVTNQPIIINSGLRNEELNKLVGGASNSQHLKGEAADIYCQDMKKLYTFIRHYCEFDQMIVYLNNYNKVRFIHISRRKITNRNCILFNITSQNKNKFLMEYDINLSTVVW